MPRWLLPALLLPALVLALPPLERRAPAVHGNDGFLNYVYLRSPLVGGDLGFADDCGAFDALGRDYDFLLADTPRDPTTGRTVNRYGWGSALLWSPFVVPAHLLARALPALSDDGFSSAEFLAVRLGSAFWGSLGLLLLMNVARRRLAPSDLSLALSGFALLAATNLGFYLYLHPSMSTAPAFGLAGLALWQVDRLAERRSAGRLFALGLTLALLAATRYGDLGFALGLLPALWAANVAGRGRDGPRSLGLPTAVPALVAGAAPVVLVQGFVWWRLYGSPISGPAPYLGDDYAWGWPGQHAFPILFSTNHGWIAWHPVVLVGLIGLVMLARDRSLPMWLRLTPLAVAGQWLLLSMWPVWHGGASFGGRLMATALAVVLFGLVAALREMGRRWGAWAPAALVLVLAAWNLVLLAAYAFEWIPRQGPVNFADLLGR